MADRTAYWPNNAINTDGKLARAFGAHSFAAGYGKRSALDGTVIMEDTVSNKVLKDILLAQGELERYYDGAVPLNLWRALNARRNEGLFDLVESPFKMSNGRVRRPDITIERDWVRVRSAPRGASTFDRPGVPGGKDWVYYRIPQGTVLPPGLAIVKDSYNEQMQATHYTIAPAYDMPLVVFKRLLNQLAMSALRESA